MFRKSRSYFDSLYNPITSVLEKEIVRRGLENGLHEAPKEQDETVRHFICASLNQLSITDKARVAHLGGVIVEIEKEQEKMHTMYEKTRGSFTASLVMEKIPRWRFGTNLAAIGVLTGISLSALGVEMVWEGWSTLGVISAVGIINAPSWFDWGKRVFGLMQRVTLSASHQTRNFKLAWRAARLRRRRDEDRDQAEQSAAIIAGEEQRLMAIYTDSVKRGQLARNIRTQL